MKLRRIVLLLLLSYGGKAVYAQTAVMDSLSSWRKNYIETHELLKTEAERSWLRFFPLSPKYRVVSTFEKLADSAWFPMPTSGAKPQMARRYGRLNFKLHDTTLHLIVYQMQQLLARPETKEYLFIGFTDRTSAEESYGAGRYIDCTIGDIRDGKLVLDFNRAYNPYCAYNTGYNCPIPPRENDLPVAILAGEKNYGKKVH